MRACQGPDEGVCILSLDKAQAADAVDLSRLYRQKCTVFTSGQLPFGRHVLRIECCGQRGALSSGGQSLSIDGFLWLGPAGKPIASA